VKCYPSGYDVEGSHHVERPTKMIATKSKKTHSNMETTIAYGMDTVRFRFKVVASLKFMQDVAVTFWRQKE
jgi:hypothetical protein